MMTLEKQDTMRMEVLKRSVNRSIGGGGGKSSPPIARDGSGNMGRVWTATGMLNHNPNLRGHHINSRNYYGNSNDSTNSVKEEEPEGQGKQLGVIDLSGMCLDRIPNPNTFNPASIFKLDLSGNNLQSIPESLTARLLNVVVLDVHSNQLSSLPNSIGCLSKLKTLNVSGNFLTSLPVTIENCKSLEELDVNFNKLKNLPDTIGFELPNLKKLSVNSNKLVRLPYSLCHLTTLRVLDVRLNCLCSLPEDLENLINLQTLNVSQNFQYLRELPYSIGLLLSLVELDVSYNSISTLPSSIGCLRKLQKLSVEGNPLISPPKSVIKQGLQAIKVYMGDKINNGDKSPKKKSKWFSRLLKKHGTIHSSAPHEQDNHDSKIKGFATPEYRLIDALASPRYLSLGRFSPRRLFSSPRHDLCSR